MYAVILVVLVSLVLLYFKFIESSTKIFSQYDPLFDKAAESAGYGSIFDKILGVLIVVFVSILFYQLVKTGLDQFSRSVGNIFHQRRRFPDESVEDYDVYFMKIRTKLNDWYTVCRQWLRTIIRRQGKDAESGADVNDATSDTARNLHQKK